MGIPSRMCFDQLPLDRQLGMVLRRGTYLIRRVEGQSVVNLYHLGNFFVEVYYDPEAGLLHHCRTFVRQEELEQYAGYIDLPEW